MRSIKKSFTQTAISAVIVQRDGNGKAILSDEQTVTTFEPVKDTTAAAKIFAAEKGVAPGSVVVQNMRETEKTFRISAENFLANAEEITPENPASI